MTYFDKKWEYYASRDSEKKLPLCFVAAEDNCTVQLNAKEGAPSVSLEYSLDNQTYNTYAIGTAISLPHTGNKIYFKGSNTTFGTGQNDNDAGCHNFALGGKMFARGNIMSLVDPTCASLQIPGNGCFRRMFWGNKTLLTPPVMPATRLKNACYSAMYYGCSSLLFAPTLPSMDVPYNAYNMAFRGSGISIPPRLPATSIEGGAYYRLFNECPNLLYCPELPATTLPSVSAYGYMCSACTSLRHGPSVLPAVTSLSGGHYQYMFSGCSSMKEFPVIMAENFVAASCFTFMFNGCTKATGIVELFMTQMGGDRYLNGMFRGCKSISGLKVHFTNWTNGYDNVTGNWFDNSAEIGTFMCPTELDTDTITRGPNTIPSGWTISKY